MTPASTSHVLGIQACVAMPSFMQCWGLNQGLHACQASSLPTEPQPSLGCYRGETCIGGISLRDLSSPEFRCFSLTPKSTHKLGMRGHTARSLFLREVRQVKPYHHLSYSYCRREIEAVMKILSILRLSAAPASQLPTLSVGGRLT